MSEITKQTRAIIGDRHFILANPKENKNIWAVPGSIVESIEPSCVRNFKRLTCTTEDLRRFANKNHQRLYINTVYPVTYMTPTERQYKLETGAK